ncbi:hypothetical protein B0H66DRAFT_607274 [Apodospora peruviana]|uniref:Uncharacterized protein n=1 Tax=Apodospora peruviana TaxID=516989 RepID=A0AAE0HWU3_9PEZI|nr:hypothetical protein B0H66DRAFT_607274 [Apodospora peruviana]
MVLSKITRGLGRLISGKSNRDEAHTEAPSSSDTKAPSSSDTKEPSCSDTKASSSSDPRPLSISYSHVGLPFSTSTDPPTYFEAVFLPSLASPFPVSNTKSTSVNTAPSYTPIKNEEAMRRLQKIYNNIELVTKALHTYLKTPPPEASGYDPERDAKRRERDAKRRERAKETLAQLENIRDKRLGELMSEFVNAPTDEDCDRIRSSLSNDIGPYWKGKLLPYWIERHWKLRKDYSRVMLGAIDDIMATRPKGIEPHVYIPELFCLRNELMSEKEPQMYYDRELWWSQGGKGEQEGI